MNRVRIELAFTVIILFLPQAATTLCKWVIAIVVYSEVYKEVEPKRLKLAEMNQRLSKANADLKEKRDSLNAVIEKVRDLQEQVNRHSLFCICMPLRSRALYEVRRSYLFAVNIWWRFAEDLSASWPSCSWIVWPWRRVRGRRHSLAAFFLAAGKIVLVLHRREV